MSHISIYQNSSHQSWHYYRIFTQPLRKQPNKHLQYYSNTIPILMIPLSWRKFSHTNPSLMCPLSIRTSMRMLKPIQSPFVFTERYKSEHTYENYKFSASEIPFPSIFHIVWYLMILQTVLRSERVRTYGIHPLMTIVIITLTKETPGEFYLFSLL